MRKGQYDIGRKTIYFIVVIFFLTFIFLYMRGVVVGSDEDLYYNLHHAKAELILQQLSTSPNCFAYHDAEISRTYPGILDSEKLTKDSIDSCMKFYEGFNVKVGDKLFKGTELKPIHTVQRPVLLMEGDGLKRETLTVEVANV